MMPNAVGTWGENKLCLPPEEVALKRMDRSEDRERNSRQRKQHEQTYKGNNPRKCLSRNSYL